MTGLIADLRHRVQYALHSRLGLRKPQVLINSIPKSGTHLAHQYLKGAGMRYVGYVRGEESEAVPLVEGPRRSFVLAHVHRGMLPDAGECFLLYRNPVDVAVSMLAYFTARPDHPRHARFHARSCEENILEIIQGGDGFEPLAERYTSYRDWAVRNGAHAISFEEMRSAPLAFVQRCGDIDRSIDEATLLARNARWNPTRRVRKLEGEDSLKDELRKTIREKERRLWDAYQELQSLP